ncbi:MAG: type I-B CRISPR-associated protein Cas7/Cst2/DevR [Saprospiraceae bacterium]
MKNLKTQGYILIDVDAAALNNAGKSTDTTYKNGVDTKRISKNGETYVYVSGQAWRYWWRDTLQKSFGWELSPITRDKSIAFTNANPLKYPDDDVFGYMRAAKEEVVDKKGKVKFNNVTVTRVSPLKNSAIISVASTRPARNWSGMSRQEGDAVPFVKDEYSAIMKGMFSLDLEQVGTFANYNKTGFKNLTEQLKKEALENGATEINDPFIKDANGEAHKLVRLEKVTRTKRILTTLQALKVISGGAMQTNNMADVTPKFIILSTMKTGNHPFSHVFTNKGGKSQAVEFNDEGLKEVLEDYKEQFEGKIYIGVRNGLLTTIQSDKLKKLVDETPNVELSSVNKAIDSYCSDVEKLIN